MSNLKLETADGFAIQDFAIQDITLQNFTTHF